MEPAREAVIRLEGHFDRVAALRLRNQTVEVEPRTVLDFSHVETFDDSTLSLLTVHVVLLRRSGHEVALLGLREHQLRMLHHFGVELAADGSVHVQSELPFSD